MRIAPVTSVPVRLTVSLLRATPADLLVFTAKPGSRRTLKKETHPAVQMLQHRTTPRSRAGLGIVAAAFTVALLCTGCGPAGEPPPSFHPSTPAEAAALTYYIGTVKPVFKENCYRCHYGLNRKSGFNLGTRALVLKGGSHGVAVVPGHPEQGLLMVVLRHAGPAEHPMPMPQKEDMLPQDQLAVIAKWIADGAIMDR